MNIYVDELPKNCKECPLHRSGMLKLQKGARYIDAETCVLGNYYKFQEIDNEIDTCPLETTQSLKQQVREEVVEDIRQLCEKEKSDNDLAWLGFKKLNRILDQVKGENNVKD